MLINKEPSDSQIACYLPYPYTSLARFTDKSGPINLQFQISNEQFLRLHGTEHTNNPHAPQYADFRASWQNYLEATADNPSQRLAIIEGREHAANTFFNYPDPEIAAIKRVGVNALTCLWAQPVGIRIKRPEPPHYAEIGALLNRFSADEVVATYAIRQASQLSDRWREGDQTPYDEYIRDF